MQFKHGGHVRDLAHLAECEVEELLDFSANINPLGPPEGLRKVISRHFKTFTHYPDPDCQELCDTIASKFSLSATQVVCGNGSTELLYTLPHMLSRMFSVTRAVIPVPGYIDYGIATTRAGLTISTIPLDVRQGFSIDWQRVKHELTKHKTTNQVVIIGQPANPSGALFDSSEFLDVVDIHSNTLFVVDEAFADFTPDYQTLASHERPNVITLRSMTKFYAIPGLRLGYVLAPEPITKGISDFLPPWSVGSMVQAVGVSALQDDRYAEKTRTEVPRLRKQLHQGLIDLGHTTVFPSVANYLLIRVENQNFDAQTLAHKLLAHRIAIRVCDNYEGLDNRYFRIAVRTEKENEKFLNTIGDLLNRHPKKKIYLPKKNHVPAIMFQGTSSNAGKSVLTAAFCRILLHDGYRVAPFKAQNMSLNSYVTREGGEMGRAQVVQAQACRLDPDVRMNPVLLKPNSETGSQIIISGKPVGNMNVDTYIRYKPQAFEVVKQAYTALSSEMDAMVIEGAGSPGEINLREHDIVNMTMADYAQAPVLLVGDIDRGGVFASFVGTTEVLLEWERELVAGFIINRFRGQKTLLHSAIDYVREHTGLPTFGVVPYLQDLGLPEEDSVSFKTNHEDTPPRRPDQVEIAIIDIPHISNFTDFDPLELERDVCLRIIRKTQQLESSDAIIIPGSKNVPGDLSYLRQSGIADQIVALARKGTTIIGICGGMQILGTEIADPYGIESKKITHMGLSLLPIRTVLESDKTLKATSAYHPESGLTLKGYEIHHGDTRGEGLDPAMLTIDGQGIGFSSEERTIFGTYLHGLYDNDAFRRWFIDTLRVRRGLTAIGNIQVTYDLEPALDRLADIVRENLDIKDIYRKMGL